ncbi:MAG: alanine:cation symporter family protein, partial [Clostridia bacterium]|nr:alanine:cation symporter family protein [Clostridia bacterium]
IVGTMTAVCLLASGYDDIGTLFEMSLGKAGTVYLLCAVFVFAFAAILSWCFYGEKCIGFLHGEKRAPQIIYKAAVTVCAFTGCLLTSQTAFGIADIFNYLMMIPNMYLLFKLRRQITYG